MNSDWSRNREGLLEWQGLVNLFYERRLKDLVIFSLLNCRLILVMSLGRCCKLRCCLGWCFFETCIPLIIFTTEKLLSIWVLTIMTNSRLPLRIFFYLHGLCLEKPCFSLIPWLACHFTLLLFMFPLGRYSSLHIRDLSPSMLWQNFKLKSQALT